MISSHVVHFQTFKSNFYKANSKLKNKSVKKIISIGRITSTVFKKNYMWGFSENACVFEYNSKNDIFLEHQCSVTSVNMPDIS